MEDQPQDIGAILKEQLTASVQNMDVVSMLQNIASQAPEDEESLELRDKLSGILGQYNDMSDTEKTDFAAKMKEALVSKIRAKLNDQDINLKFEGLQEAVGEAIMYRLAFVAVGVLVLIVLFVFFGYKLYKSIKDKEVKREEKKKAKQMKKKK